MDFNTYHFALFGLTPFFRIDQTVLDERYREIQAQVHPDRFVEAEESQRRLSLQWATRANEGYQTLKKPLSRALYLLELAGAGVNLADNHAMSPDFLMEQMEWREAVVDARETKSLDELEELDRRVRHHIKRGYEHLGELLDDQRAYRQAADSVRQLMFLEKLLAEIDEAIVVLEG